jgi:hypothetical protein
MSNYLVRVRFANELHWVTEFVTPSHPHVQSRAEALRHDIAQCYFWVSDYVLYPLCAHADEHEMFAFKNMLHLKAKEYWQFPAETLGWMDHNGWCYEDCDGQAILLCSLLRTFLPATDVYVGLGGRFELEHAWVRIRKNGIWYVLDTTLDEVLPLWSIYEKNPYNLYAYFNDQEAVEVVKGTFAILYEGVRGSLLIAGIDKRDKRL